MRITWSTTNRPSSVHTMDHSHPFPSAAATPSGPTVPSRSVPRYIDARQFHARNRLVDVAFSERRAERRDAPPLRTQTRLVRCTFNEYTHTWLPPSPGGCCYYWPPFSRMDRFDGYESSRVFAQGSFFPFLFFLFIRFVELLFFCKTRFDFDDTIPVDQERRYNKTKKERYWFLPN